MHHNHFKNQLIHLNMLKTPLLLLVILFGLLTSYALLASDLEREKQINESVKKSILIGDVVTLEAGGTEFLGLINDKKLDTLYGSVIILHGKGSNPNSPQLIQPLRSQLAELGWVTLSVQLPVASKYAPIKDSLALIKDSVGRIQASLRYMGENYKNTPCVLIAHSLGAMMATNFIAQQETLACDALTLISLPTIASDLPEAQSTELLEKITIPVLDIYGSQDLDSVLKTAPTRKLALMNNNIHNRQIEISGADHAFNGLDETLVRSIHNWLIHVFKNPQSTTIKGPST